MKVFPTDRKVVARVEAERLGPCRLSAVDIAAGIVLKDDAHVATGRLGYRTVRATHGVDEGSWYFEVRLRLFTSSTLVQRILLTFTSLQVAVEHLGESGHVRLGVGSQWGDLQGPVGIDAHSYGYCSSSGDSVFNSQRQAFGTAFGEGDRVGIHLVGPGRYCPPRHR